MFFGFDLTQAIQVLGYPGIFATILAESGLFFAVYLPGGSLLFTAGLLASQGFLNIYILLAIVITAAILGDTIGYWFGSWIGPALWRRPDSRFFKKRYLEQTRDFFDQHGTRTIFLARFIPIIRTFAPILAGVAQMNYRTFFFFNALGAVVWGGGFVVAGYLLGEAIPGVENYLEWIVLAILIVTSAPFFWHVWQSHRKAQKRAGAPALPRAVIFDLDDTLTESFQPPKQSVLDDLAKLARHTPLAIMSGGHFKRLKRDVIERMSFPSEAHFYVFSDNAAQCHAWERDTWREIYNYELAPQEKEIITEALREVARETGVMTGGPDTSRIVDRETSVAWTALEFEASPHEKRMWDPDGSKRKKFLAASREKLPDHEVLIGGKTSIDVLRKGISKVYGVEWFAKELGVTPQTMLFIGDSFGEGGNDAVVIPTGIQTMETSGPEETVEIIDDLLGKIR